MVTTNLPSLVELRDILKIANGSQEFIEQVEEALREGNAQAEKRIEIAGKNTWDSRIEQLLSVITNIMKQH